MGKKRKGLGVTEFTPGCRFTKAFRRQIGSYIGIVCTGKRGPEMLVKWRPDLL